MPIEFTVRYTRPMLQENPSKLFVFGDNEMRRGLGGQAAACRYEPNAVGITTKWTPSTEEDAFYTDLDRLHWRDVNRANFAKLHLHLSKGLVVVWPADGIGTGRAELPERAPSIAAEIESWLDTMIAEFNKASEKPTTRVIP